MRSSNGMLHSALNGSIGAKAGPGRNAQLVPRGAFLQIHLLVWAVLCRIAHCLKSFLLQLCLAKTPSAHDDGPFSGFGGGFGKSFRPGEGTRLDLGSS